MHVGSSLRHLGGCLWRVDWQGVGSAGVSSCKLRDDAGMEKGTLQHKNRQFLTNTATGCFDVIPPIG